MNDHLDVAIIGAGFAGLGMAIQPKGAGERSFVVLERAGEVGGTWRENHYRGCCCDVPSHAYRRRTERFDPEAYELDAA